jgi:hypothetical protein
MMVVTAKFPSHIAGRNILAIVRPACKVLAGKEGVIGGKCSGHGVKHCLRITSGILDLPGHMIQLHLTMHLVSMLLRS